MIRINILMFLVVAGLITGWCTPSVVIADDDFWEDYYDDLEDRYEDYYDNDHYRQVSHNYYNYSPNFYSSPPVSHYPAWPRSYAPVRTFSYSRSYYGAPSWHSHGHYHHYHYHRRYHYGPGYAPYYYSRPGIGITVPGFGLYIGGW